MQVKDILKNKKQIRSFFKKDINTKFKKEELDEIENSNFLSLELEEIAYNHNDFLKLAYESLKSTHSETHESIISTLILNKDDVGFYTTKEQFELSFGILKKVNFICIRDVHYLLGINFEFISLSERFSDIHIKEYKPYRKTIRSIKVEDLINVNKKICFMFYEPCIAEIDGEKYLIIKNNRSHRQYIHLGMRISSKTNNVDCFMEEELNKFFRKLVTFNELSEMLNCQEESKLDKGKYLKDIDPEDLDLELDYDDFEEESEFEEDDIFDLDVDLDLE